MKKNILLIKNPCRTAISNLIKPMLLSTIKMEFINFQNIYREKKVGKTVEFPSFPIPNFAFRSKIDPDLSIPDRGVFPISLLWLKIYSMLFSLICIQMNCLC